MSEPTVVRFNGIEQDANGAYVLYWDAYIPLWQAKERLAKRVEELEGPLERLHDAKWASDEWDGAYNTLMIIVEAKRQALHGELQLCAEVATKTTHNGTKRQPAKEDLEEELASCRKQSERQTWEAFKMLSRIGRYQSRELELTNRIKELEELAEDRAQGLERRESVVKRQDAELERLRSLRSSLVERIIRLESMDSPVITTIGDDTGAKGRQVDVAADVADHDIQKGGNVR